MYKKEDYFLKPPRFEEKIEEKTLQVDPPPGSQKQEDMPAILTMGSMLMMGMSSMITGVVTFANIINGNTTLKESWTQLLTAAAMLSCMLILPAITRMYNKHRKKVYERKRQETYSAYIAKKNEEFLQEMKKEQNMLVEKYIPLKDVGDVILYKKRNLWEKNIDDFDFLSLRLGIGSIPPFFKVSYPDEHFSMEEEDNLMSYLRALQKETKMLENVPVSYSFQEKYVTGIIGPKYVTQPFVRGLLLQLFAYHGYDSLKICVFTNNENAKFWDEIKNTPYIWNDQRTIRFFGTNGDDISQISAMFEEMLAQLKESDNNSSYTEKKQTKKLPSRYIIFTDDIDAVRNMNIVRTLVESPGYIGISLIMITEKLNSLPNEVEHFISVDERSGGVFERELAESKKINFVPDFMFSSLDKYAYVISNIPIALNGGKFILPTTYTFLEMYNVSNVNQLNVTSRWKMSDPINSLSVPIGINEYERVIPPLFELNVASENEKEDNFDEEFHKIKCLEIYEVEEVVDLTPDTKMRDKAIIETLLHTGLRVSELVALNKNDIQIARDLKGYFILPSDYHRAIPVHVQNVEHVIYFDGTFKNLCDFNFYKLHNPKIIHRFMIYF